jgi:hypothetical protein
LSYVPRLDFDPTFANNFATRQDLNPGIDKIFNFDRDLNRVPGSSNSSESTVWSFGFSAGGQRRFWDPAPQSYALFFNPSASYIIAEQWNASFSNSLNQQNLTIEPTGIVEYVIPSRWLGGADTARMAGSPAVDFFVGAERNWSNISGAAYNPMAYRPGLQTGWRF